MQRKKLFQASQTEVLSRYLFVSRLDREGEPGISFDVFGHSYRFLSPNNHFLKPSRSEIVY